MKYPIIDVTATGANIERYRVANNMSVKEVAGFMGFSTGQAVYKWQKGEGLPSIDNLFALSRLFGVTMGDLLVEKE